MFLRLQRLTVGALVCAVFITGCGAQADGSPSVPDVVLRNGPVFADPQLPLRDATQRVARQNRSPSSQDVSWMAPEARTDDLLYVTNLSWVSIYSYPKGRLVGKLKHFTRPEAECVDGVGDVLIADGDGKLYEYPHGGRQPIKTFSMYGFGPQGCSVDPTTGDLAISWDQNLSKSYVAVYPNASGNPKLYKNESMLFLSCGYDAAGNLFVDGEIKYSGTFAFAELPKGGSSLRTIKLSPSFENPGAVQWDGRYIAVGDDEAQKIYRFKIRGTRAKLEGTTDLGSNTFGELWWIDGRRVVSSNVYFSSSTAHSQILYYNYPQGGDATKVITKGLVGPFGVTISKAPTL